MWSINHAFVYSLDNCSYSDQSSDPLHKEDAINFDVVPLKITNIRTVTSRLCWWSLSIKQSSRTVTQTVLGSVVKTECCIWGNELILASNSNIRACKITTSSAMR